MRLCKLCGKDIIPVSVSEHMVTKHNQECFNEIEGFANCVVKMMGKWIEDIPEDEQVTWWQRVRKKR